MKCEQGVILFQETEWQDRSDIRRQLGVKDEVENNEWCSTTGSNKKKPHLVIIIVHPVMYTAFIGGPTQLLDL